MNDTNRHDAHEAAAEFRLDQLEERLNAFFADKKKNTYGYICCENVGRPWERTAATL
jgi:hypothetical protein